MGEYARYRGQDIKIGTCENMYYLRADQRGLIDGYSFDAGDRFRFPFPDEDNIEPGQFDDHDRGVRIPGYSLPAEMSEHGSVQFVARAGYLVSLPCPEQFGQPGMGVDMPNGVRVARNGFNGHPVIRQQRVWEGRLVTVISCNACGALWRLETLALAAPVIAAFRAEATRQEYRPDLQGWGPAHEGSSREFFEGIADRIEEGYAVTV